MLSRFCTRLRHSAVKSAKKRSMGEIDQKKAFESVQDAISMFGDKSNHIKSRSCSSDDMEKEDVENLRRKLAKLKLKLEEKDAAYKQAILKLDQTQSVVEEHSSALTQNELEKEIYVYEGRQDKSLIKELESRVNHLEDEQHVTEKEVVKLRDANLAAIKKEELAETILDLEREKTEKLHKTVAGLGENNEHLKKMITEANQEKTEMLVEKDALREKLEMMNDLENQVLEKSGLIYSLQMELHLANEKALKKPVIDGSCQLDELKAGLKLLEKKNFDQAGYIDLLETELIQLKEEQRKEVENKAKEKEAGNEERKEMEQLKKELESARTKMGELRNRGEQAISRAEAAEKAKATLEEQIQRRRDQKRRRKAALAALQEASTSREINSFDHETSHKIYQPLGEVLNMRF